jgi:ABC-type proline/glycine betaine transport system ATPase subunit
MAVSSVTRAAPQALTAAPDQTKNQDRRVANGATAPNAKREAAKSARSEQAVQMQAKVAEKQRMQEQEKTAKAAEQTAKREAPKPVINSQGQKLGQVLNATA